MRNAVSGGGPSPKPPRPVHVAALRRADKIVQGQRARQQQIKQVQQLKQHRIDQAQAAKQQRIEQARNRRDLQKYGFIGASQRSNARKQQVQQAKAAQTYTNTHQPRLSAPSTGQVLHAQTRGYNPGTPGPFASVADKRQAAVEKKFHAPQTLGELGVQTSQLATGINPRHPLDQGPYWLAANLGMSLLPVKGLGRVGRLLRAGKTAEEAASVAKAAAPEALGPVTREQAQQAAKKEVAGSLMGERRAAAEQKKVYKAARAEKFAQAQQAGAEAGGGIAGFHAEKGALKGALPRVKFEKLKNGSLNQHDLEGLFNDVANHPDLSYGETLTARTALAKAFEEGHALAPHEIRILSKAFGEDATKVLAHKSFARKVGENAVGVLNLPRALMASVDISFPGRQGLGVLAASPRIWTKGFKPQLKGLVSEEYYHKMLGHMHQDPAFSVAQDAGVKFTELGKGASQREEPFATNVLTNRPEKYNPIRASARAYTMYGDYVRLELFKKYLAKAERQGVNIENKNELRDIGKVVNTLSGRGGGKTLQQSSPLLNTVFFAPQLIKSRLDMLNPLWYSKHVPIGPTTPFATRQAKIAGARLGVGLGATLGGAAALGAKVQTDPRNADFAKIRVGNTRVDIAGGLAQYPRAISQIASGKVISSTTGKTMTLGPGFGQMSRKDVAERFGVGKLAPPMSAAYEALQGRTFLGQPLTVKNQVVPRVVPFGLQDAYDAYKQTGSVSAAAGAYGLSAIGEGVQTYGPQDPAKQTKKTYQKFNDEVNQALKKIHADFPPVLRGRLKMREERAAQSAKAGKTTADHFAADITLLVRHKAIDSKTARGMIQWARGLPDDKLHHDQISSARSYLTRTYFDPNGELAAFVRALRRSGSPNLALP
jgi:hypothetical protein